MKNDQKNKDSDQPSKKEYVFGGIKEFDLVEIEKEVLNDSVYLDVFAGSDPAFKKNVNPLKQDRALSILNLKTYSYEYDRVKFKDKKFNEGERLGLMADEVEKMFPECVAIDEEGYRYVNYSMLVVPLLETVKQLELKVKSLEKRLSDVDET